MSNNMIPGDYPQNPLPTIFAEPVANDRDRSGGDMVIRKGTISMLTTLLIGMMIAGSVVFYFLWKGANDDLAKVKSDYDISSKKLAELTTLSESQTAQLSRYAGLEQKTRTFNYERNELRKLIAARGDIPPRRMVKLNALLADINWRDRAEAELEKRNSDLSAEYDLLLSEQKVVVKRDPPPIGAILPGN